MVSRIQNLGWSTWVLVLVLIALIVVNAFQLRAFRRPEES